MAQNATNPKVGASGSGKNCSLLSGENTPRISASPLRLQRPAERRQRLVEQLHRLGPAPLAHFIRDLERGGDIDATLEIYAELPADLIRAYGGDRFAPPAFLVREAGR